LVHGPSPPTRDEHRDLLAGHRLDADSALGHRLDAGLRNPVGDRDVERDGDRRARVRQGHDASGERMTADDSDAFAKIGPVMVGGSRVELAELRVTAIEMDSLNEGRAAERAAAAGVVHLLVMKSANS
jgi:hypothetical protein